MLEAELFSFLEGASDAVLVVRETGEICFWNQAAQELFGYPEDKVMGEAMHQRYMDCVTWEMLGDHEQSQTRPAETRQIDSRPEAAH